jgi:multicomponent Na+:H+ antiporter subunit C
VSLSLLVLVGVLFAAGTYLLMERSLTRVALGVGVLGNGANLLIVVAGSDSGQAPIVGRPDQLTDPLPQALVLTAIVIGFALLSFVLALAWRNWTITENDGVEDDFEDRSLVSRKEGTAKPGDAPHHEDVAR